MMLYKIVRLVGDHGVSVFPPEEQELPPVDELAGEPITNLINNLKLFGYTEQQARWIISAWAYHAKFDLNQGPVGVRVFCEMCIKQLPKPIPPVPAPWYALALAVAVLAAVALGLYLWVTLDKELNLTFGSHKWAYVMSYQERLWQGEVLFVASNQEGVYEQGSELWSGTYEHRRNEVYLGRLLDRMLFFRQFRLAGRRLIFWHEYQWIYWDVFFCGCLTHLSGRRYRLRESGNDPYKPTGLWLRPGGDWGTPEYEGCWQEWWWL